MRAVIQQPDVILTEELKIQLQPRRTDVDIARRATVGAAKQKITVCFLIDNLNVAGTENHLVQLIRDLDRNEFEPILVLLDGLSGHSKSLEPDHCEVVRLGFKSFLRPSTLRIARRFSKWLRQRNVDVLQLYFPDSSLFGAITGRWAGVKTIIRTRRNSGYWMTAIHRLRGRLISRLVDATIVNSPSSEESVIEQEHADPRSISLIPNGVDLDRFQTHVAKDRIASIGMLTNLREVKRVDVFISAAALLVTRYPDLVFEIAGDGPLRIQLQGQIEQLGLTDCIRLVGSVTDVPGFLQKIDLLVSCSESEGLSNSMLEAMASRTPIVATDISGNQDLIEGDSNGLLVPVGDPAALAQEISRLIEDRPLVNHLQHNGYELVRQDFDQKEMVKVYQSLYRDRVSMVSKTIKPAVSFSSRLKSIAKISLVGLAILLTLPWWLATKLTKSEQIFLTSAQFFSMVPGLTGVFIRRGFYAMALKDFSWDCHVEFGTWFSHRNVRIAKGVYIGARCTIGMVDIEKNVLIGSNVDILSGKNQHHFDDVDRPISQQGGTFEQVKLGAGCWVGNSSVVMDEIGCDSIVGAGSVVAKPIPDRTIAVGNPAKVVRER